MNRRPQAPSTADNKTRGRLLISAALFLVVYAAALTLSPAARARTWEVDFRWEHWLAAAAWGAVVLIAYRHVKRRASGSDPYLLPVAAFLSGWGLLSIWRLTTTLALRQTLWLVIGVGLFILGLRLDNLNFLRRYKYLWLTAGLGLTATTLILGTNPQGAGPRLWLGCCDVYLQPSEPLKLLLVVFLAAYLADRRPLISKLMPLLAPTLLMTGLALLLLVVQRDLGTASVFILIYTAVTFAATGKRRIAVISLLTLAAAGAAGYLLFDVVRLRVDAWFNPWLDPSGRSFQIVQSTLAVAAGGIMGRGPGLGSPSLVPVAHSDFIYAAIVEETGLIGSLGLLALFGLLTMRGLRIASLAQDAFHRYLALGLSTYLAGQSILIVGGNLRLVPLTGVTLPFLSYGGSSLVTSFLALLLLTHVSKPRESGAAPLPTPRPLLQLGAALLTGLVAVAVATGWWAVYRGPALLTRTDNARRAIADRYVQRGTLLAREGEALNFTQGEPGSYERVYLHPEAGSVVGYTHPVYGQAGLEASLDAILRGLEGQPPLTIWYHHLLYGQPPPGLDVRLSLDLNLQSKAEQLLEGRVGALVLLDAESGEILAMASRPSYNPAELEALWPELIERQDAPLVNRATQGSYQPGAALGPMLLAAVRAEQTLPPLPEELAYTLGRQPMQCARPPAQPLTWESAVAAGCPAPLVELGQSLGGENLLGLFQRLGLYQAPELRLPVASQDSPAAIAIPAAAAVGQGDLRVSPLQMALAAASLSNGGLRPTAHIALAVERPDGGWEPLPPLEMPQEALQAQAASLTARELVGNANLPIWEAAGAALNGPGNPLSWFLSGTLPDDEGRKLTMVVLLEEDNAEVARAMAVRLWLDAIQP